MAEAPILDYGGFKVQLLPANGQVALDSENHEGTLQGHAPVSVVENFWARLLREGRGRSYFSANVAAVADGSYQYPCAIVPSPGSIAYPKRVVASCTVDAVLAIQVNTGIQKADLIQIVCFCKAGTPLVIDFDGEAWATETGVINVGYSTTIAGGKFNGSIQAVEVMPCA